MQPHCALPKKTTPHAKHHPTEGFRLNVPKPGSVVKRRDDRSKNDCIPVQSTRKTKYLAALALRQKTRKDYDQLNHEEH